MSKPMNSLKLPSLAILTLAASFAAAADSYFASTDKVGYTGTVTIYNAFEDAVAGINARSGPFTIAQRDAQIYIVKDRPTFGANVNVFQPAHFYTTAANTNGRPKDDPNGDQYYSGQGNPNKVPNSFVEMWDPDNHTMQTHSVRWTDATYSTFTADLTGAWTAQNGAEQHGRFWTPEFPTGSIDSTMFGRLSTWHLQLTATGLQGQDLDGDGFVEATGQPSSVSGSFTGIFQNTNIDNPSARGFYKFALTFNDTNWAFSQGDEALNGNFLPGHFGAAAVPEPASIGALGLGILALWRKRRKSG